MQFKPFVFAVMLSSMSIMANAIESGPYAGISAGLSTFDFDNENFDLDNSFSGAIYGGYKITPYFGVELAIGHLGEFTQDLTANNEVELEANVIRTGISAWGDLAEDIDMFIKLQLCQTKSKLQAETLSDNISASGRGIYYEIGALFDITQNLGVTTSVSYLTSDLEGSDFSIAQASAGLHLSF